MENSRTQISFIYHPSKRNGRWNHPKKSLFSPHKYNGSAGLAVLSLTRLEPRNNLHPVLHMFYSFGSSRYIVTGAQSDPSETVSEAPSLMTVPLFVIYLYSRRECLSDSRIPRSLLLPLFLQSLHLSRKHTVPTVKKYVTTFCLTNLFYQQLSELIVVSRIKVLLNVDNV